MNPERIGRSCMIEVLRHQEPAKIPVLVSCDPYNRPDPETAPAELKKPLSNVQWRDESPLHLARYLGGEVLMRLPAPVRITNRVAEYHTVQDGSGRHSWIECDRGELHERWKPMADGPMFCTEFLLETPEDLEIYRYVVENDRFELDDERVEEIRQRLKTIGDDGMLFISFPGTPLGQMVRVLSGVRNLAFFTVDCPQLLRDTAETIGESIMRRIELLENVPVDGVFSVDDTSTSSISPAMFETYSVPFIHHAAEVTHAIGKFYIHHSCGLIHGLLDMYRETPMDAVHAVTTTPMGDVEIRDVKRRLGNRITQIPGLISFLIPTEPFESVFREVDTKFREGGRENFMLQLSPDQSRSVGDMERVMAVINRYR